MKTSKKTVIAACWLLAASTAYGQQTAEEATTSTASYQIGVGPTYVLDTYLSQEKFSGTGLTLLTTHERQKPGRKWTTLVQHQASFSRPKDRSHSRSELQGGYSLYAGRHYRLLDREHLKLQAGGLVWANLGAVYNSANNNNPVQVKLGVQLMPSAAVASPFTLLKRRWTVRYEVELPLAGLMFSPNYGQSYYEIFSLGNYDRNIVPTTLVSAPNFRQQLSVDCRLWKHGTLRIGYLGDYQQADVNNLKSHIYTHRVMIGFVRTLRVLKN